jgi:hypothetical protein
VATFPSRLSNVHADRISHGFPRPDAAVGHAGSQLGFARRLITTGGSQWQTRCVITNSNQPRK